MAWVIVMRASVRRLLVRHVPTWLHPSLRSVQHSAALIIGRLLRSLPGTSRRFGPPRGIALTLSGYVLRHQRAGGGAEYIQSHGRERIYRAPPKSLEREIPLEFRREMTRVFPRVGTALIERGRVLTRTGVVIGPDDRLLADVSSTFMSGDPAAHPIFMTVKLPRVTKIEDTVAVLTTYRSNIYYHWLLDTLPRLQLLEESGFSYEKIVVPGQARFQKESLNLLGLDSRRLITDANLHLEAKALVVPSLPAVSGNQPPWACDFLRRSFLKYLPCDVAVGRRVYVSRKKGGTRHLVNELDLFRMLERRGFECVFLEEHSFLDQVRLFNEAEIVVSTHGSGLANLVFCRPGAAVVELFSPNYMNVMYWALSDRVGLSYHFVKGEGGVSRERGRRVHEDILIDVSKVAKLLDRVEQSLPSALLPAASALG